MAVIGKPRTFDKRFLFQIEIDGFLSFSFAKCSPLQFEIGKSVHWEGGSLTATKSFGRLTFKDLELERGKADDVDMYAWAALIANAAANAGATEAVAKRHGDLVQRDRDGSILKRYSIFGMWPTVYEAGEWDNNSDEAVIEKMTLTYDYFVRTF